MWCVSIVHHQLPYQPRTSKLGWRISIAIRSLDGYSNEQFVTKLLPIAWTTTLRQILMDFILKFWKCILSQIMNVILSFQLLYLLAGQMATKPTRPPTGKNSKCAEKKFHQFISTHFLEFSWFFLWFFRNSISAVKNPNQKARDVNVILERRWDRLEPILH